MITVSGRKGKIVLNAVKSMAEAEAMRDQMVKDGFKNVTIDDSPKPKKAP